MHSVHFVEADTGEIMDTHDYPSKEAFYALFNGEQTPEPKQAEPTRRERRAAEKQEERPKLSRKASKEERPKKKRNAWRWAFFILFALVFFHYYSTVTQGGYLAPCATEDSTGCYWDADTRTNHQGHDIVTLP